MNTITIFTSAILIVACFVNLTQGSCYLGLSCYDVETNKTYSPGDSWRTPKCTSCDCSAQISPVKLCLELLPRLKSVKKSKFPARFETDINDDNGQFVEVVISEEAALNFECPPIEFEFFDAMQSFRFVSYVTKTATMHCCTAAYPVQIPLQCEAVLNKQTCQHNVYLRNTKQPCTGRGPMSFIGK